MINKVYQNDTCWLDYQYCSGRWHILGNTLLQSAVCCGTAMAEVMTDFALLEAAEDGEILEDITDDVTEGSNVEDIMFEVPLSDGTDSECCSRVFFSHQKILSSLPEDTVFSSKQLGERSWSNTAPTCSLRISWMPLSRGRLWHGLNWRRVGQRS